MRVSKYVSIENAVYVEHNNDDYIEQENIIYPKQENIEDVNEFINNINERKKLVKETIEFINNKTPKVISNPVEKKPMMIDYEKVNKRISDFDVNLN